MNKTEWLLCPVCGEKIRDRIREDTVLKNFLLYCPKCEQAFGRGDNKLEGIIITPFDTTGVGKEMQSNT